VFRDITARNQAERELSYLAAIVHSSEDVIIGKDLEGTILSWNAGAERTYGYKASEVIGRNISLIVPPERPDELPGILKRLRQGQAIDHMKRGVRKDGTRILVALTISPIMDRSGRIIGASTIARDITERRQAQFEREQLLTREQQARTQAEIANRAKDQFLANLSHELRNPLNAILGWARLLRSGQLDEATAARGLEIIERNVTLQNQLVADLLDVSRIVTGKIHLDVRSVDLCLIIDEAINTLRLVADAKSIQLRAIMDTEEGHVAGDAARLQQVVWNLLSNAIKFTPPGGEVQVRLKGCNSHVEISSDTGQASTGISSIYLIVQARRETRLSAGMGTRVGLVRAPSRRAPWRLSPC
jgi:PAS domain S-box-containing protein